MVGPSPSHRHSRLSLAPAWLVAGLALVLAGMAGCTDRVGFEPGIPCDLTSQCEEPLVCRLERCRVECVSTRDCPAGFMCVEDAHGLEVCQVQGDLGCLLDSQCPDPLVCRDERCVNVCEQDVDCPGGQQCVTSAGGGLGCEDPPTMDCLRNTDCPEPLVCGVDRVCRVACRADRDCPAGEVCGTILDTRACVVPLDGGP